MQKDRWLEINRIFHAALDLPPEARPGFLSTSAAHDPDLQSEVERLLEADQQADSYLESPLIPPGTISAAFADAPLLQPGDVLCERFHILRSLGAGGMGHVFEAHDSELAVNVALKLIRPEIASNPTALARFRQEVRLARRITHPNVCRTYDLDRDTRPNPSGPPSTLVFLTMEFLAGETLAARLKRSPALTTDEILTIARDVSAALDAAHAFGIIHRDIKPGNIMLVPPGENSRQPGRVVITDFGLARLDPIFSNDEHSITHHSSHSNQPIGTLAYMAPEQMDGRPISAATDIYAFGLVLFEMATGQRAFPASNLLSGIALRLTGPAPSPRALNANLPESLVQAIQGCLHLNPEDRFQSAQAVLACLAGHGTLPLPAPSISFALPPKPQPSPGPRFYSRRSLFFAAILPVAVSLFLLGQRFSWWKGNPVVTPGALVYLAPITNQTGEKSLDNITELLQASLEQSAHINLLDQGRAMDILQNMTKPADTPITEPIGREIAMRANAARVVFSSVTGSQGRYTLNVDIQRPDYTPGRFRSHWTQSFSWKLPGNTNAGTSSGTIPQELSSCLRDATEWVRNEIGESQNDIARLDASPEDVTTGNWEAFADYTEARRRIRENHPEDAVAALKRAVQIDPQFALAYASLGDVLISLHREIEGFAAYDKALDAGLQNRLTRKEEDRIRGMRAVDTHDYELAIDAFHDLAVNYPQDVAAWTYPTEPLRMLRRDEEAVTNLRKAVALDPEEAFAPWALSQELMIVGRTEEIPFWIAYLEKHQHPEYAADVRANALFLAHRFGEAAQASKTIAASKFPLWQSYSYQDLASIQAETGHPSDAIDTLNGSLPEDVARNYVAQHSAKLLARAYLEIKLGRYDACLQDVHAGFALNPAPESILMADTVLGDLISVAPAAWAPRSRVELTLVQSAIPSAEFGNLSKLLKLRTDEEIQLAGGNTKAALIAAQDASAKDALDGSKEYLGRALVAEATQERNETARLNLLRKARDAYATIALHPAIVRSNSSKSPPGFFKDQLESYLRIAGELQDSSQQIRDARIEDENLNQSRSTNDFQGTASTPGRQRSKEPNR